MLNVEGRNKEWTLLYYHHWYRYCWYLPWPSWGFFFLLVSLCQKIALKLKASLVWAWLMNLRLIKGTGLLQAGHFLQHALGAAARHRPRPAHNLWALSRRRQPPVCLLLFRVTFLFVFAVLLCKNSPLHLCWSLNYTDFPPASLDFIPFFLGAPELLHTDATVQGSKPHCKKWHFKTAFISFNVILKVMC